MGRKKLYSEEEKRERNNECKKMWRLKNKEYMAQYRETHKQQASDYNKQYYQNNKKEIYEKRKKYLMEYNKTPKGRASILLRNYERNDKKYNRGKGDLTSTWIVENIFTKKCVHCGESDWTKIGCNRINNDLPHTMDNVEPCCKKCNDMLHIKMMKTKLK